jgi:hypothetical protein
MRDRDPEKNFEELWETFHNRYPFFDLRKVDWEKQYDIYRPIVRKDTSDDELFQIFCEMLAPLNDGHVEIKAGKKRKYRAEKPPRFYQEFDKQEIKELFKTTRRTLADCGFGKPKETEAWMLRYCKSADFGYLRILELEGVKKRDLSAALNTIARDFDILKGLVIDIRNNPGGDDDVVLAIVNRLCDCPRIAFHRRTKIGPEADDLSPLKTWHMEPQGEAQFTGPIVVLSCDAVFSGAEVFAMAIKQLPYVTIIGDHTNGIFSYQLEKKLPNGWEYDLSYQIYMSADMVCYEGKGVPADIKLLNKKGDIEKGVDPLIIKALDVLRSSEGM